MGNRESFKTFYIRSKSGLFDAATFQDSFVKVIVPWTKRIMQPKVLIGENLSSHIEIIQMCQRFNIRFAFNLIQLTQPLDANFLRPLKQAWQSILTDIKIQRPNTNCNKYKK